MKAFRYLMFTRLKNKLKLLIKSPGQLIFVLFLAACFALSLFSGTQIEPNQEFRPHSELYAMVLVLFIFVYAQATSNGFSSGASLYTMQDVNFVFPAPISAQKVLFYGLLRQLGTSLLLGFFLLFQYGWLNQLYGVSIWFLLALMAGFGIAMFCGQLTAMVIYSVSSGNDKRRRMLQNIFYAVLFAAIAYLGFEVLRSEDKLAAAVAVANGPIFTAFPVAGWLKAAVQGAMAGNFFAPLLGLAGAGAYLAALIVLLFRVHTDFYEDVLSATETAHQTKEAAKEGMLQDAAPKKVRVGRTGLSEKGKGASAFYYKHKLENRRSRTFLLDPSSLIFCATTIVFAFAIKDAGIIAIFAFGAYMQVFSVALGRIGKELLRPYAFLVPEPPFAKLINCLREGLSKIMLESLLIFVPVSLILGLSPLEAILCIVARIACGMLFTSANVFVERFFYNVRIKAVALVLYFTFLFIFLVPGIAAGIGLSLLATSAAQANILAFAGISAGCLITAFIALFCSRNLLAYSELSSVK